MVNNQIVTPLIVTNKIVTCIKIVTYQIAISQFVTTKLLLIYW